MLARQLGMTPVTLRQRLCGEGQSFAYIKDEIRSALAQPLLHESAPSMVEIACEPGFTERSAFHRAFRKWTGARPGAFHHDLRDTKPRRGAKRS